MYTCVYVYTSLHVGVCVCMIVCVYTQMCVPMFLDVCALLERGPGFCVCAHMSVCVCVWFRVYSCVVPACLGAQCMEGLGAAYEVTV